MVFSSLTFLGIFLPLVIALYFFSKDIRWRNGVLLLFSIIFYSWGEPIWVLAMIATTANNYICGLLIAKSDKTKVKKIVLLIGVVLSLMGLIYFKYSGFFLESLNGLFGININYNKLALPIGISFYTFQSITYTVDVYRNKTAVQKNPAKLLLYVSMFPQLIAGPIVRYGDIADMINNRRETMKDFIGGMQRFAIGLGKKVLLANVCAAAIDNLIMADSINKMSIAGAWFSIILFAFQIYYDFSGYSDMAIGMGRIFGFKYKENFKYPYIADSVSDFWRRWHISLGSFFREYVYIPLGGNRVKNTRMIFNLLIVWLLTGLWHGASLNFVLWGLYYGIFIIIEKLLDKTGIKTLPKIINIPKTLIIVLIGWVFFYYTDLNQAIVHLQAMIGINISLISDGNTIYVFKEYFWYLPILIIGCIPVGKYISDYFEGKKHMGKIKILKACFSAFIFLLTIIFLVGQSFNPFLYFRF